MERNEDDVVEIERLREKIYDLKEEIFDLQEEVAIAQVAVDFREAVRDAVGVGWDASDERVLQTIRSASATKSPDPTLASKMGVDRVGGGGHGAAGPVVHDPD